MEKTPSPLDRPFWSDDPPLSVWKTPGAKPVVAPANSFPTLKPSVHEPGSSWPPPDVKGEPIGIEIVRGTAEDADKWHVQIDGMRCTHEMTDDAGQDVPVCVLPPPFPTEEIISLETTVRPLAIGVRLEGEAISPDKVEIIVEQVVHSSERVANSVGRENEILEVSRTDLTPYRPTDIAAKALALPYPICAPAQSALAIVSFKEFEDHGTAVESVDNYNDRQEKAYKANNAEWQASRKKHRVDEKEKAATNRATKAENARVQQEWQDKQRGYDIRMRDYRARGNVGPSPEPPGARPAPAKLAEHKGFDKKKPRRKPIKIAPAWNGEAQRHFVIGGGQVSAAAALLPHFTSMVEACVFTRSDDDLNTQASYRASMQTHLRKMREYMDIESTKHGVAVFETLMTGTPSPVAQLIVKQKFSLDRTTGEITIADDGEQARTQQEERVRKAVTGKESWWDWAKEAVWGSPARDAKGSQFVYDRLPLNERAASTTRMRIVVEITEHAGGAKRRIILEPRRYEAIRAHAVYAELRKDVDNLKKEMNSFVDCLFGLRADRGRFLVVLESLKEKLSRSVTNSARNFAYVLSFGNYGTETDAPPLDPFAIESYVTELNSVMELIIPIPELPSPRQQREVQLRIDRAEIQQKELEFIAKLEDDDQDLDELEVDEFADIGEALSFEQIGANPVLPGRRLNKALKVREVVRELPQVVRPEQDIVGKLVLKKPVDTATPDEFFVANEQTLSHTTWLLTTMLSWAWLVWGTEARVYLTTFLLKGATIWELFTLVGGDLAGIVADGAGVAAAVEAGAAAGVAGVAGPVLGAAGGFALAIPFLVALARAARNAATGLGKIYVNSALEQVRAFSTTVPEAWSAGVMVREWTRQRKWEDEEAKNVYKRAVAAAKGSPIESSLAAAKESLRLLKEKIAERALALKEAGGVAVLFNDDSKQRFRFFERYTILSDTIANLTDSFPLYDYSMWQRVANTSALTLLPPADVLDTLLEVEVLRDIPIAEAIKRVTGKPNILATDQSAELAASAAHHEIFEYVISTRFPLAKFTGDQLLLKAEAVTLAIVERATRMIKATYGSQAGVTLVYGDDPLWSCLASGVAARMALRHSTTFVRAEFAIQSADPDARFGTALKQWQHPQRVLIDVFADNMLATAKASLREASKPMPRPFPNGRAQIAEAVRSFERVAALTGNTDKVPALMVAARFAGMLQIAFTDSDSAAVIVGIEASERLAAREFLDQQDVKLAFKPVTAKAMEAAWAARRIDKNVMLSWQVAAPGANRVDDLISELSGITLKEEKRQYYVPFGVRLTGLPGTTPFDTHGMDRLVWIEPLRLALSGIALGVVSGEPDPTVPLIDGVPMSAIRRRPNNLEGFSRHPLVLSVQGSTVVAGQAIPDEPEDPMQQLDDFPESVVQALEMLTRNALAGASVEVRTSVARSMAFNADRLAAALDLFGFVRGEQAGSVKLPSDISVLSLCIAVALHHSERGGMNHELYAHVVSDNMRDAAKLRARYAIEVCDRALGRGCKIVSLAELCAVLCHK